MYIVEQHMKYLNKNVAFTSKVNKAVNQQTFRKVSKHQTTQLYKIFLSLNKNKSK